MFELILNKGKPSHFGKPYIIEEKSYIIHASDTGQVSKWEYDR